MRLKVLMALTNKYPVSYNENFMVYAIEHMNWKQKLEYRKKKR